MKYKHCLSFLLSISSSLSILITNNHASNAQDSFASKCYLNGSLMRASGEGATKYAHIFLGYEVCAYYKLYPNRTIIIKGSDGITQFTLPANKDIQTCINQMRENKTKTCLPSQVK